MSLPQPNYTNMTNNDKQELTRTQKVRISEAWAELSYIGERLQRLDEVLVPSDPSLISFHSFPRLHWPTNKQLYLHNSNPNSVNPPHHPRRSLYFFDFAMKPPNSKTTKNGLKSCVRAFWGWSSRKQENQIGGPSTPTLAAPREWWNCRVSRLRVLLNPRW